MQLTHYFLSVQVREFVSVDSFGSCKCVVIRILNINKLQKIDKKMSPPEIPGIRQALEWGIRANLIFSNLNHSLCDGKAF